MPIEGSLVELTGTRTRRQRKVLAMTEYEYSGPDLVAEGQFSIGSQSVTSVPLYA